MESRFDSQLKKGVLEMLVLGLLCRRQTYGYQLLGSIRQQSGGYLQLKEGTLYPILYRLEDEGAHLFPVERPGPGGPQKSVHSHRSRTGGMASPSNRVEGILQLCRRIF